MSCKDCTPETGLCEQHQLKPWELEELWGFLREEEERGIEQLLRDLK